MGCCDARRDHMDLHPTVVSQEVLIAQSDLFNRQAYINIRTRHIWIILSLGHGDRWNIIILKAKFHRFLSVLHASACGRFALQIRYPNFPMRLYTGSWIARGRRGRYKRQSGLQYTDIWWLMQSALSLLRLNSTSQSTPWSPGNGLCLLRRAACNLLWLQWHRISYPILPFAVKPTGRGSEGSAPVLGW